MSKRSRILKREKKIEKLNRTDKVKNWLVNRLGGEIKKTEGKVPSFVFEPKPIIRKPEFDYISLFEVATTSWPLRRAFRAIIQEATREDVDWIDNIVPRFRYKCTACGEEYQAKPKNDKGETLDKCSECEGELITPNVEQKPIFRELLKNPNPDYKFRSIVRSSIFYDLSLDDVYWSIAYGKEPLFEKGKIVIKDGKTQYKKVPKHIYVEDSRFMFPVADEYGHLGGWQWYCEKCYGKGDFAEQDGPVVEILPDMTEEQKNELKSCQYCGGPMTQTAYVEEVNGTVLARWPKEEIVHGSSSSVKPSLFGNPKIISLWKVIQTILAMDDYNYEVYSEGKVGAIIAFPGEDQVEIDEKKTAIETELQTLDNEDIQTGRYRTSKKIRNIFLGTKVDKPPLRIPIMEDLKKMQSVEYFDRYLEAIGETYGVTPSFVSTSEPGQGSSLKIEVQNRTTEETQANFLDPFNNDLLPRFGITDWILKFNPIEGRDELRDSQVMHTKVAAMLEAARIGLDATIDENGEVKITGKAELVASEGEGEGSRMGEKPRNMGGKPRYWEDGSPSRVSSETMQLRKEALIPISWYSATQIRIEDKVYALTNDKDEVYLVINDKEEPETRMPSTNINHAVGKLIEAVLKGAKVPATIRDKAVQSISREFDLAGLIEAINYLEKNNKTEFVNRLDNLRERLSGIKLQTESTQSTSAGEMLEPIDPKESVEGEVNLDRLQKRSKLRVRTPFGVENKEETLTSKLNTVLKWVSKEVKGKRKSKREHIINEAINKAKAILDADAEEIVKMSIRHTENRLKARGVKVDKITLSPEELKRVEMYKKEHLEDFEKILRDKLSRKKKI